jgi:hypothetical protein
MWAMLWLVYKGMHTYWITCQEATRRVPQENLLLVCWWMHCANTMYPTTAFPAPAGFLPYNQLAANSLKKGHMGDMSFLVGGIYLCRYF